MKILQKKIGFMFLINFGGKLSFILFSFFLSATTAAAYIFTASTCTTTIITLKLCNSIKFPYFANTTERGGDRGWKQAQGEGEDPDFPDNSTKWKILEKTGITV